MDPASSLVCSVGSRRGAVTMKRTGRVFSATALRLRCALPGSPERGLAVEVAELYPARLGGTSASFVRLALA